MTISLTLMESTVFATLTRVTLDPVCFPDKHPFFPLVQRTSVGRLRREVRGPIGLQGHVYC